VTLLVGDQVFLGSIEAKNRKKLPLGIGVYAENLDTRRKDFRGLRAATHVHTLVSETGPLLTSLIYPLEFGDGFNASSDLQEGDLSEAAGSINVSTALVAGTLDVVIAYQTLKAEVEGIDVSTDLATGDLVTVIAYQQIKADPDGIDVSTDLVSGDLTTVISYVTHRDPADDEGVDVSTALVGGTLS
jgi:hypothetical protein